MIMRPTRELIQMSSTAKFSGFESFTLTGIEVSDQELGHGSYATVLKLDYMGLQCAGKKIHETLLRQGYASYTVCRFEEECHILSQVRHPNIVQFLGVHFEQGLQAPILVMEVLPMNLTTCIEQHGVLAQDISYSLLHDVALGLRYLHNRTPPIIHRDLSSNNVLLTSNLKAKIADLGVARILNLTPLQVSRLTQTPGTPTYMPPEVMVAKPKYDKSIDVFSYGILMIHSFSGRWPEPQIGPTKVVAGKLLPVTEAERRMVFIQAIGNDHPVMDLILKCINNDPDMRADINEVTQQLAEMKSLFPVLFSTRLEMLKHIEGVEWELKSLKEDGSQKDKIIQVKDDQISSLKQDVRKREVQKSQEIERLNLAHRAEVEQLRLQVRDLTIENSLQKSTALSLRNELEDKNKIISIKDDAITRKDSEIQAISRAMKEKDTICSEMHGQLTNVREYLVTEKQGLEATINWKQCADLPTDLAEGQSVFVNNRIYFAGTGNSADECKVQCYDPPKDKWSPLPLLPVRYFGLGQVNGELVAIGGVKKSIDMPTNEVYIYDAGIDRWKQTISPMPTSRAFPGVLSLQSIVLVVGGLVELYDDEYTSAVEVYKSDTTQWYKVDSLPTVCQHISTIAHGSLCFILAKCNGTNGKVTKGFHASADDLIQNAVPAGLIQARNTQSLWKELLNVPSYKPAAAILDGHLIALGGWKTSKERARKREIYAYSLSLNSWIYIGDLPAPRSSIAVAILSRSEFMVMGGYDGDDNRVRMVCKGTLNFQFKV